MWIYSSIVVITSYSIHYTKLYDYKTLSSLEDLALVEVHKFIFSNEGKKIKQYRSRIGKVEITLNDTEPVLHLYPNKKS